jgi:hypothetical protein
LFGMQRGGRRAVPTVTLVLIRELRVTAPSLTRDMRRHSPLDKPLPLSTILINSSLGVVAQLVRVPPCHGGCRGFESRQPRMIFLSNHRIKESFLLLIFFLLSCSNSLIRVLQHKIPCGYAVEGVIEGSFWRGPSVPSLGSSH